MKPRKRRSWLKMERTTSVSSGSTKADDTEVVPPSEKEKPLPSLDGLVQRIPAEVRTALDELFRARFTSAAGAEGGSKIGPDSRLEETG